MRLAIVLLFVLLAPSLPASEVYRCVTENGVVRYSDTPCNDGEARKLDIDSRPTDEAAVQDRIERRKERIAALNAAEAGARKARAKAQQQARQREQRCAAARKRLQQLRTARRIRSGEGEEGRFLESGEIEARRADAARTVSEVCG